MQDLTLIRDEDALPLQGADGRLRPGPGGLLDTIEDLGTGRARAVGERPDRDPCALTLFPSPAPKPDDPGLSVRCSTSQADPRTETSEDDLGDKAPKRTKSIKKVPKAEVRPQAPRADEREVGATPVGPGRAPAPSLHSQWLPRR